MENKTGLTLFALGDAYLEVIKKVEDNEGILTPELEKELDNAIDAIIVKQDGYILTLDSFDKKIEQAKEYIERLRNVVDTYKSYQERMKNRLIDTMHRMNVTELDGVIGKVKMFSAEKVPDWVTVESVLEQYKKTEIVVSLKKAELKDDLKKGIKVGDIELESNEYVRVYKKGIKR